MGWKDDYTFEKRHSEARRIKVKYPHRVPVICEPGEEQIDILDKKINKNKTEKKELPKIKLPKLKKVTSTEGVV